MNPAGPGFRSPPAATRPVQRCAQRRRAACWAIPAPDANGIASLTLQLVDDSGTASGGVDASAAGLHRHGRRRQRRPGQHHTRRVDHGRGWRTGLQRHRCDQLSDIDISTSTLDVALGVTHGALTPAPRARRPSPAAEQPHCCQQHADRRQRASQPGWDTARMGLQRVGRPEPKAAATTATRAPAAREHRRHGRDHARHK